MLIIFVRIVRLEGEGGGGGGQSSTRLAPDTEVMIIYQVTSTIFH